MQNLKCTCLVVHSTKSVIPKMGHDNILVGHVLQVDPSNDHTLQP